MPSYTVKLTEDAVRDLEDIYNYIAAHDASDKADYVLDSMDKAIESLASFPERGSFPKEFLALGIREYRQTFFKPYRVIYRILARTVYVLLIVDGRRDMASLLARRTLDWR